MLAFVHALPHLSMPAASIPTATPRDVVFAVYSRSHAMVRLFLSCRLAVPVAVPDC